MICAVHSFHSLEQKFPLNLLLDLPLGLWRKTVRPVKRKVRGVLPIMICILLFCLLKDGDIDFILAPAVGSLTTAATGSGQGPSTSTIPGETRLFSAWADTLGMGL